MAASSRSSDKPIKFGGDPTRGAQLDGVKPLHHAGGLYRVAGTAHLQMEIRLRDVTQRTIEIGTDWNAAKVYLEEGQAYWLAGLLQLGNSDLDNVAPTNWGDQWPLWKIINSMIFHDHYHAGQIALTRTVAANATEPPPPISEEEIAFLKTFSAW